VNSIIYNHYKEVYLDDTSTITITYSDVQGGWVGTCNINADPLFVGGGDYHLTAGSPCIDTGTSVGAPTSDLDGNPRPYGAGYDMGAYEYQQPTLITLSSFTATPSDKSVLLKWTTESEIDNAGFNIYRSEGLDGDYIKINASLIPAVGTSSGGTYQYLDSNVVNRTTYFYKLENIDIYGDSEMNGPRMARRRFIYGIRQ
jgi:hypothetical protein